MWNVETRMLGCPNALSAGASLAHIKPSRVPVVLLTYIHCSKMAFDHTLQKWLYNSNSYLVMRELLCTPATGMRCCTYITTAFTAWYRGSGAIQHSCGYHSVAQK